MKIKTENKISTYLHGTLKWYYVPVMIYKFLMSLPSWNFETYPKVHRDKFGWYKVHCRIKETI